MLEDGAWLRHARHANAMAQRLAKGIEGVPGVQLMFPVEANAVFAEIPAETQAALRNEGWRFYTFIGDGGCRLMCAFDTLPETVDRLVADVRKLSAKKQKRA